MLNLPLPQLPAVPMLPPAEFEEFFFDFPGAARQFVEQQAQQPLAS